MNTQRFPAIGLAALVLIIITGTYLVLKQFQQKSLNTPGDPFAWVPDDAAMVLHVKNPSLFLQSLTRTGPMAADLEALLSHGSGMPAWHYADSLITHDEEAARFMSEASVILSHHPLPGQQKNGWLAGIIPGNSSDPAPISRFIKRHFFRDVQQQQEEIAGHTLYELIPTPPASRIFYTQAKGQVLISSDKALLIRALNISEKENSMTHLPAFEALRNAAGRFADNLYITTAELCRLGRLLYPEGLPFSISCSELGGWQTWDVSYNPGEIILNGFADPDRRNTTFLTHLAYQEAREAALLSKLPLQSGLMLYLGLSEAEGFRPGIPLSLDDLQVAPRDYELRFMDVASIDPDSVFAFWNGELAMSLFQENNHNHTVIVLGCEDCKRLQHHPELSVFMRQSPSADPDLPNLLEINIPGFFQGMTRGLINEDLSFALFYDDYLVAAQSEQALSAYVERMRFGQHFLLGDAAQQLHNLLPDRHTLLLHASPALLANRPITVDSAAPDTGKLPRAELMKAFNQLSLQLFPTTGNLFFSNMLLTHQPGYTLSNPLLWESPLKGPLSVGPVRVVNHTTGNAEIILQDTLNNLYLLDMQGSIIWEKELSGPIMSDIHQVDIYKNNRLQYLFNTRNFLHLIDRNGEYVRGYPMRLPAPASSGIAVFDYDTNRNYRIIFAAENLRIYNYSLARRPVSGWEYTHSNTQVNRPVQHIRAAGKDFLFVTDSTGTVQILNRRGVSRLHARQKIQADPRMRIFSAGDGARSYFVIAGRAGEINQLSLNGNLESFQPDTFSPDYRLVLDKFSDRLQPDFIYLDKGNLMVFNAGGRRVMTIPLGANLGPWVMHFTEKGKFIGLTDTIHARIFMVDEQANLISPFPIAGDTSFFLEKDPSGSYLLITGFGSTLRGYKLSF